MIEKCTRNRLIENVLNIKFLNNKKKNLSEKSSFLYLSANQDYILKPKKVNLINTGIAIELKTNHIIDIQFCQIKEMQKQNLYMLNYPGTIDMDYRGEIKAIIYNMNNYPVHIYKNDIIGYLSFKKIIKIRINI